MRPIRAALWAAALLNLGGVVVFGAAAVGLPSVLPTAAPQFYAAQLALVIGIFAGVYAWLAGQPSINRPLLLVGAVGKLGFFALAALYWAAGDLAVTAVGQAAPDLVLGLYFAWWLAAGDA